MENPSIDPTVDIKIFLSLSFCFKIVLSISNFSLYLVIFSLNLFLLFVILGFWFSNVHQILLYCLRIFCMFPCIMFWIPLRNNLQILQVGHTVLQEIGRKLYGLAVKYLALLELSLLFYIFPLLLSVQFGPIVSVCLLNDCPNKFSWLFSSPNQELFILEGCNLEPIWLIQIFLI